jgi:Na+/glutamate symporter
MEKEQRGLCIFVALASLIIGILIGYIITDWAITNEGISQTSYCKEVQIDTIQYNYQRNMYKYKITLIK